MSGFYKQLDELYLTIEEFLESYGKSTILQRHFMNMFESFFYATFINNFFINLNRINVKELKLPRGKIGQIKSKYKYFRKDIKLAISASLKNKKINYEYYKNFTSKIQNDFPEFHKIIQEIETLIDFKKVEDYLKKKSSEIKKFGKIHTNLDDLFLTKVLEIYVQREKTLSSDKNLNKLMKDFVKKVIPEVSQEIMKTLKTLSNEMLDEQREYQKDFEKQLYQRWKEPLDLLECLIRVSLEAGERQKNELSKITNTKNNFKHEALILIHARALQIANEILVLLKAGFADGANSRWRSLHELAVISFFLFDNTNDVSKRYLEHEIVRTYKELKDYRTYYKKLGYLPISRKEANQIKRDFKRLLKIYPDKFQEDYGWISRSILSNRNFRALEERVNLNKLRPFYNLASDAVHAGSKGFYRLGLKSDYQDKILLVGASNYGLADPLQNTAISLSHVSVCLLNLTPSFENLIQMQVILNYVKEMGISAVDVHESIEKEEHSKLTV